MKPQKNSTVKSGSQKMQGSMVRRWLHELEPVNHLENQGPPRLLCLLPTNPKPESIHCRRNTDHLTHPPYPCSSFLFRNLCGPEKAASALPHSAPVRKQLGISSNGSEIGTKLLVPASLRLSKTNVPEPQPLARTFAQRARTRGSRNNFRPP